MKLNYTNQMLERLRNKTIPSAEDISDMIYYFCKDIQTETGKTAEQCPVENESQLMRWLPWDGRMMMRMLQKYKSLAEDPDDCERMARMETKLREIDEALERTQKTKALLEEKEKQLDESSQQLEQQEAKERELNVALQEMAQKLTDIAQQITQTEQQKQTLSGQITEQTELLQQHKQEKTELEQTLQTRREEEQQYYAVHLRPLENRIAEHELKIEKEKQRKEKHESVLDERQTQLEEYQHQIEQLIEQQVELTDMMDKIQQKLTEAQANVAAAEQDKQTLDGQIAQQELLLKQHQQEKTELEQTLQTRREEEQQYYHVQLRPLEEQLTELKAQTEQLDLQKQGQEARLAQIREENNKLVLEIAELDSVTIPEKQNGIHTKQTLLESKRAELSALEITCRKLQKDYDDTTDRLSQMQSTEETLRSVQLPHIQKLCQAAGERVKELENGITAAEQTLADTERQIEEAEAALTPLCERIRERTIVLDSKKRSLRSQNQEYERLNQDLERLDQATSEEELNVLIATAQADIERLQSIQQKCREYEQECQQTTQQISAAVLEQTEKKRELEEKRGRYEAIRSSIREIENQLTPLGTEEYRKRLSEMTGRLEQLRKIKSSLTEDLEQICCCLQDVPIQQNSLDTLRSEALLQTLEQAIGGIQNTLKSCIYAAEKA